MMFFFFSSRRRHTSLTCDWSSDVCSSDLARGEAAPSNCRGPRVRMGGVAPARGAGPQRPPARPAPVDGPVLAAARLVHRLVGSPRGPRAREDAMKVRGRVERRDLEGGIWQLVAEDGKRYTLVGAIGGLKAGAQVEVEGTVDEGFGIAMAGPQLRVQKIRSV